jgi:hypothetical protein
MIRHLNLLLVLSLLLGILANTQGQIVINGRVITTAGVAVPNASIILQPFSKANILTYTFSQDNGSFELLYKGISDTLTITVSGFNIAKQSKTIFAKTQTVDFKIEEKAIELKEVKVQATKIWGSNDTINYLVSAFTDKKDLVIGDVLRKMPGINVSESGAITYNGKAINKFYIENLDLLQGRYGIAVNNITAKDVSTVQILENHQPIKALAKSQFSSEAALNLKLKEGAKGTFNVMAQLGVGASPLLYDNELTGMYFAKGKQNITTYKGTNSGVDLSNELRSFSSDSRILDANIVNVQMPASPGISQKRYLFNNSNAATINNLKEFKPGRQLNFNFIYLNDFQTRKSAAHTSYYLPGDSILKIDEKLSSSNNIDKLETELRYSINEGNLYLNNYLNIEGTWERSTGDIFNSQIITQSLYRPSFYISNSFNWIKKSEKGKGFELKSVNGYQTTPQTLIIRPGLYTDIFTGSSSYYALEQDARLSTFQSKNYLTLLSSFIIHKFTLNPKIGFNIESQNLNSELRPLYNSENVIHTVSDSMKNNLSWFKSDLNFSTDIHLGANKFNFYLFLPVSYNYLYLYNHVQGDKQSKDYVFFQPSFSVYYKINHKMDINGGYFFNNQLGNIQTQYPGYILQSYRRLNAYDSKLSATQSNGGSLSLSYKDLVPALFMNISFNYNHTRKEILYGQTFIGIMNIISSFEKNNVSENASLKGKISKGFDFWSMVIGIESMYGNSSSEQLRQSELVNSNFESENVSGSFTMKPASWMSFSYKGTLGESWGKMNTGEKFPLIRSVVSNYDLNLFLPKDLNLTISHENYYTSAAQANKNMSFTDLGIWYTWKKTRISLDCTNIFNTKNYVTAYYSDISAFQNVYDIRPVSIMLKVKLKIK